ncbi:MAG: phosphoribosylamine--glycine ligase [Pseudomonadota bacterium]
MNVAIIGSGGREHVLEWKIKQSPIVSNVFVIPGNGGTENNLAIAPSDFQAIEKACVENDIKLIIPGPEAVLAEGIYDYFKEKEIFVFGPSKQGAMLESSKLYAKEFMSKYGVATAKFHLFNNIKSAEDIISGYQGNVVIKFDGLAAGKGVYVCANIEEAKLALNDMQNSFGKDAKFFVEEKLEGVELSIIGITDGKSIKLLQTSQDHKQLLENDQGPNTGGMGAFCPVDFCNEEMMELICQNIVNPTMEGLRSEVYDYVGIVYFGLMLTQDGPKVLEYNVRFGDPEAEVILPALKTDLLEIILSCFNGNFEKLNIEFNEAYYVDVVLASGGYPKSYEKGFKISGLDKLNNDSLVFHAGTKIDNGNLVNSGGRVLNIIAHDKVLKKAIEKVYEEVKKIEFRDVYYRKDIGMRINKL